MSELFLDRDGRFFYRGAECLRAEITRVFFERLEPAPGGGYRIVLGREVAPVDVAEAPLRVWNLLATSPDEAPLLVLDAGLTEPLDPATLRLAGDVPWCRARGMDARFTPTAALALADFPALVSALERLPASAP